MSSNRKLIALMVLAVATWFAPSRHAGADMWDCYNGGQCQYLAMCEGTYATGFCWIQCWDVFPSCNNGLPGECHMPGASADCGNPT